MRPKGEKVNAFDHQDITMKLGVLVSLSILFVLISMNIGLAFSSSKTSERTVLYFYHVGDDRHNAGEPLVFVGKLTSESGKAVAGAKILIKNDGPCPNDHIIASGTTHKDGIFWILTAAKIWDESDNLTKVHAEFTGNEKFSPSISYSRTIVVYPLHGEKCVN